MVKGITIGMFAFYYRITEGVKSILAASIVVIVSTMFFRMLVGFTA